MAATPSEQSGSASGESDLFSRYAFALVLEAIVIVALYWLGRYFG